MIPSSTPADSLKHIRKHLLEFHRELIASEKAAYEKSAGRIPNPGAFLQLLAHDPWFEWLQPLTALITRIDETLADREKSPDTGTVERFRTEIQELLSPDRTGNAFQSNYAEVLLRDPLAVAARAELLHHLIHRAT